MRVPRRFLPIFILGLLFLGINWFIRFPVWVEDWYSHGFYLYIASYSRFLFGWLPFSIGDLLYLMIIFYVVGTVSTFFIQKKWRKKNHSLKSLIHKSAIIAGFIWVIFHVNWGINYYRLNIGEKFGLNIEKPTTKDIKELTSHLLAETNRFARGSLRQNFNEVNTPKKVKEAYQASTKVYPFLSYKHVSVKPSLFGKLGNYMGYSGYYNPITGEAQINTSLPLFTLPFTTMHEVAHQLGYAKESEANFIGYISSTFSKDSSIQYSANLEMFLYANAALFRSDSVQAKINMQALSPIAKKDLKEYETWMKQYEGPIDKMTSWFYNKFLKVNNQPEGLRSYSKVVLWLVAYEKKKGEKR